MYRFPHVGFTITAKIVEIDWFCQKISSKKLGKFSLIRNKSEKIVNFSELTGFNNIFGSIVFSDVICVLG